MLELVIFSTLNGLLYGMLLFLLASGLTLIFSMMGVLNFAHASFYMLGAYFGFQISEWHTNVPAPEMEKFADEFLKKYGGSNQQGWWYLRLKNEVEMLVDAMKKANSTEPVKVSKALSDMKYKNALGAEVFMRPTDHQLFQDMYISSFGSGTKHDEEKTGWGWKTVGVVKAQDTVIPTTCKMNVPS